MGTLMCRNPAKVVAIFIVLTVVATTAFADVALAADSVGIIVTVAISALVTGAISALLSAWVTTYVLTERLEALRRWVKSVQEDVKKIKDDIYRPHIGPPDRKD